ncbi:oxidoreductase, partial [Dactylonectria macrodidyma]
FSIPDLARKVVFIIGGIAGIGKETLLTLAKHNPAQLYFTRPTSLITELNQMHPSVNVRINFTSDRLNILIVNAGVCAVPLAKTRDGHEVQFGTNHFGYSVLFKLLLLTILRTTELLNADVRLVFLASSLYSQALRGRILFENLHSTQENLGTWTHYAQSKLANILYAAEVARRYPKITAISLHPRIIGIGLVNDLGLFLKALVYIGAGFRLKSPEDGARNGLWAATTALKNIRSGAYYKPVGKEAKFNSTARDGDLAKKLWDWTEEQLKALNI